MKMDADPSIATAEKLIVCRHPQRRRQNGTIEGHDDHKDFGDTFDDGHHVLWTFRIVPPTATLKSYERSTRQRRSSLSRSNFFASVTAVVVATAMVMTSWGVSVSSAFSTTSRRTSLSVASCVSSHFLVQHNQRQLQHSKQRLLQSQLNKGSLLSPKKTDSSSTSTSTCLFMEKSSREREEREEWMALLKAFQMYRAAYGDLKIPLRFVVPSMPPWPEQSWGMKLGQKVAAIRSTGKYIENKRKRREALESLGFVWRARAPSKETYRGASPPKPTSSTRDVPAVVASLSQGSSSLGLPDAMDAGGNFVGDYGMDGSIITMRQFFDAIVSYKRYIVHSSISTFTVPVDFVVPESDPWPESTRGMPLGVEVARRRNNGVWLQQNAKAVEKLRSIGFDMNALGAGSAVNTRLPTGELTKTSSPSSSSTGTRTATSSDVRFFNVFNALKRYREIYGDLLVPQPFVVPNESPDWPPEVWGLRLGARVNAIRSQGTFIKTNPERKEMLEDIGFVWAPPASERRRRGRKSVAEIEKLREDIMVRQQREQTSSEVTGSLRRSGAIQEVQGVPSQPQTSFAASFDFASQAQPVLSDPAVMGTNVASSEESTASVVAPHHEQIRNVAGSTASSPTWGLEKGLGDTNKVSTGAASATLGAAEREASLQDDVEKYDHSKTLSEALADATQCAVDVGIIELVGKEGRRVKGKREKSVPWFNDDFGGEFVFGDVVEALTLYKSFYGNFSNFTNEEFVIPMSGLGGRSDPMVFGDDDFGLSESSSVPANAAGMVYGGSPMSPQPSLQSLGGVGIEDVFHDAMDAIFDNEDMLNDSYKDGSPSGRSVKLDFSPNWPEHLQGMGLGNIVARIRDGSLEVKHIPERKEQLDAIGFDWGDPKYFIDVPFEKAMCAMFAYYLVRGDMFVTENFIMPDEDPWPEALAGYELGKAVKRIRELQNFLEAFHAEKVGLLRMLDFVWFPTLALPIDPNEPEMTPEMLKLSSFGHPDYSKMVDIPMGLPEKIFADGPFVDSDDPKVWWRKYHSWEHVKDYWYKNGRRDNSYVLRGMGYPQMAAEHEAKHGKGLIQQIHETLKDLEGIDFLSRMNAEEKQVLLDKLNFFREEMVGCNDIHPLDLEQLIGLLDIRIDELTTGKESVAATRLDDLLMFGDNELSDLEEVEEHAGAGTTNNFNTEGSQWNKKRVREEEMDEIEIEDDEDYANPDDELGLDRVYA